MKKYILILLSLLGLKLSGQENLQGRLLTKDGSETLPLIGANVFWLNTKTGTVTDQEGKLIQVDTKGNKVASALNLAPNNRIDATTKTLITLSDNLLNIKGVQVKLPFGTYTPPKIFYLNNTLYFSTTNTSEQKVYLFYSNGKSVEGFPVYGKSVVDITNSNKNKALEMVVGTEDNSIIIYEIN